MIFQFGDETIELDPNEKERKISNHTERELIKFTINIQVEGFEQKKWFDKVIQNSNENPICRLDDKGDVISEYKGRIKRVSHQGSHSPETLYDYEIELEEIEKLNPDNLILAGIEVEPYEYSEEIEPNNGIRIDAKIKISKEDYQTLKQYIESGKYFEVIRKGINEDPISMRFGKIIWSKHGGLIKLELTLIDKREDEAKEKNTGLFHPEFNNMQHKLAYTNKFVNKLSEFLLDQDILSEEQLSSLKEKAEEECFDEVLNLYKVKDIDHKND